MLEISKEREQKMLEEGQWCYWEERGKLVNIGTGELLDTLEWLIKEIGNGEHDMPGIIKIKTVTCPKCGFRPIPAGGQQTRVLCPVCSIPVRKVAHNG